MTIARRLLATVAVSVSLFFPKLATADDAKSPGIITSVGSSVTMSTQGMPPGSEMWGLWISLPAGKKVQVSEARVPSIWMELDLNLTGSTVSSALKGSAPPGACFLFGAGWQQDFSGQENTNKAADALACNYGSGFPFWEENRGTELYTRAQLNIGGPWAPGQTDTPEEYRKAGGEGYSGNIDAATFGAVEKELRAAGAMTATVRRVTMPPGSRSITTDRHPTLRMVASGELKWGTIPLGSDVSVIPKLMFKNGQFDWVSWKSSRQVVLSNETNKPVEYIEWAVSPAQGTTP